MTRASTRRRAPGLGLLLAVAAAGLVVAGLGVFVTVALTEPRITGLVLGVYALGAVPTLAIIGIVGWALLERRAERPDAAGHPHDASETAYEAQRRLLDDVRHELKTPITIVRGHLEVMDPTDSEDVAAIRELGISELDRMTRLIGDIDLLAAVETDQLVLSEVELSQLTQRVAELVAVIPGHDWLVEQSAEGIIRGDGDRLVQAWLQLADNAAKYTPDGSPIQIGSAAHAGGVQLWVRDHGPGIPPAARHRIFRRFDRGTGKRTVGGSGLGLAIVDAIAKAHGGHCAVADTPGGGATFTLEIPIGTNAALPAPVRAGDVVLQREASG